MRNIPSPSWQGTASLRFHPGSAGTTHQGGATAPLKVQRAFQAADGRCELPILHTAGGLVGGDRLSIEASLDNDSRVLLTSVAAQKVYGTVGRSRLAPEGQWARQQLRFDLGARGDLEWLPQELVLFEGGLFVQNCRVELAADASWLGMDVVRLGRSADAETLREGRWRSSVEILRAGRWSLVERLELGGAGLECPHGMAALPVFGSLVWAAPAPVSETLLAHCRRDRHGLGGQMACGLLEHGLVARYRGPSTQAARYWFTRIWARIRAERGLTPPQLPRVWPFQEAPFNPPPSAREPFSEAG